MSFRMPNESIPNSSNYKMTIDFDALRELVSHNVPSDGSTALLINFPVEGRRVAVDAAEYDTPDQTRIILDLDADGKAISIEIL